MGYLYDKECDSIRLKNAYLSPNAATKRQILSSLASVFDPVGMFAPVLLLGKLLIREMCKQFTDWDQELDSGILDSWKHLCKTFSEVSGASFDRKVLCTDLPVQLFVFADASQGAYGCAIYIVQR